MVTSGRDRTGGTADPEAGHIPPPTGRRRRGATLESALLQAVWDELSAVGFAELTFEGVAARASTSRTVLYRRWQNRTEMVLAAMRHQVPDRAVALPDTGELRGDLLTLLRRVSERFGEVSEVLRILIVEFFQDTELSSHLQDRAYGAGLDTMTTLLRRAAERGEVDTARISPRVAALPITLLRHELFITRGPIPDATLKEIVDDVFLPLVRS